MQNMILYKRRTIFPFFNTCLQRQYITFRRQPKNISCILNNSLNPMAPLFDAPCTYPEFNNWSFLRRLNFGIVFYRVQFLWLPGFEFGCDALFEVLDPFGEQLSLSDDYLSLISRVPQLSLRIDSAVVPETDARSLWR
jgi:hypothetical protein